MKKLIGLAISIGLAGVFLLFFITMVRAGNSVPVLANLPEQTGPQWYDPAWNYRIPITIINSGTPLAWYQVQITLDEENFNFNRAKSDGSDIRFTHSDGTTELSYWIESWDRVNQVAYVWMRIPSLASGESTVYLYYNNPLAQPASNGNTTFDGFDSDWAQFTIQGQIQNDPFSEEVQAAFNWNIINITPTVTSGILNLIPGNGIKSKATFQGSTTGVAMGMRANFGLGSGLESGGFINGASGQRAMIGDLVADPDDLFLIDYRTAGETTLIPRLAGVDWHNVFHIYEVRWQSDQTMASVDHGAAAAYSTALQVPDIALPVTLYSYSGSNATMKVDWVYVRQYRDDEPTYTLGDEQGLVDLVIAAADSPDPLPKQHELTYQITVTNTSNIAASGVVVTDTLPVNVQFSSAEASQGACNSGASIVCNLGSLTGHASASITIIGIPGMDGLITNTAIVQSAGYELDMLSNLGEAVTLVDSVPPNVSWEKPVQEGDYSTFGGTIDLEASATDEHDLVAWVEFLWYDHRGGGWNSIGKDYTYPYQAEFDSNLLVPNDVYQFSVRASDRAGNTSPYPYKTIFVRRILKLFNFLPIIMK